MLIGVNINNNKIKQSTQLVPERGGGGTEGEEWWEGERAEYEEKINTSYLP